VLIRQEPPKEKKNDVAWRGGGAESVPSTSLAVISPSCRVSRKIRAVAPIDDDGDAEDLRKTYFLFMSSKSSVVPLCSQKHKGETRVAWRQGAQACALFRRVQVFCRDVPIFYSFFFSFFNFFLSYRQKAIFVRKDKRNKELENM
jgi:hypothetical protein